MRLIDADALLYDLEIVPLTGDGGIDANDLDDIIKRQPTVDAVPVIRCKDCKYAEREGDGDIMCTFWDFCECNHHVLGNGYCDRAERKEE